MYATTGSAGLLAAVSVPDGDGFVTSVELTGAGEADSTPGAVTPRVLSAAASGVEAPPSAVIATSNTTLET
jgi:hypothetical protein